MINGEVEGDSHPFKSLPVIFGRYAHCALLLRLPASDTLACRGCCPFPCRVHVCIHCFHILWWLRSPGYG